MPSWLARSARLAALALLAPGAAWAQQTTPLRNGFDGNVDLVRPVWAPENLPGIDVPAGERGGTFRGGIAIGYANSPLVLYEFDQEVGSVINNRMMMYAGISVDISRAFTLRATLPVYFQSGTNVPKYASEGFALGDLAVGGHFAFLRKPKVGMGLRIDLTTPTGRRGYYAGEPIPNLAPGLLLMFDVGRVRIATDLGANLRFNAIDTKQDLTFGHELAASVGVRVHVLREVLVVGLGVYSRFGLARFGAPGETTAEFLANLAYRATPWLWVDLAAGRGFTQGYGSSDFKALATLRFQRVRKPLEEETGFSDTTNPESDQEGLKFNVRELSKLSGGDEVEAPPPEEAWAEGEFVRKEDKRIRYRYAIEFKVGTAEILPESFVVLDGIADLMNNDARIAHVIIEGHASPEGPFELNYELSQDRAASIWKRLVEQRVHPSRLSYRGMGEVLPVDATEGVDQLQRSRRVVFHIVDQYESWEQPPLYSTDLLYPWSGESYVAPQPRMPSAEEIAREAEGEIILPGKRPERTEDDTRDVNFGEVEDDVDIETEPQPAPEPAPQDEE